MASSFVSGRFQGFDSAGIPLSGGLLYSYAAGTLTPLSTYTTQSGGVANANPVVLDSAGRAPVWLSASSYRFILKTAAGVTVTDDDNISPYPGETVTFVASGAGAVSRTMQDKGREIYSLADQGAPTDGTTSARTAIESANEAATGTTRQLWITPGTYLSNNTTIDKAQSFIGDGGTLTSNVNNTVGTLIVGNSAAPTVRFGPVQFWNPSFTWTVAPIDDNRATINAQNAEIGVFGGNWVNTATGVRIGHINSGTEATCDNSVVIGMSGKNVLNFGVEHIGSGFSRVLGLGLHNDGTQAGSHGVRWSAFAGTPKRGNLLAGSVIRDRGTSALSIQENVSHCVATGIVAENNVTAAIGVTTSTEIDGRHILSSILSKGGTYGIDGQRLTNCMVSLLASGASSHSARFDLSSDGNMIDLVSIDSGGRALNLTGTGHFARVVLSNCGTEGVLIGCSYSVIQVSARGGSQQRINITGSNNIIIVVDGNNVDPSVRFQVGANNNILITSAAGDVRCAGDNNDITVMSPDAVTITGNGNTIRGRAAAVSDSGTGNDWRGLTGASSYASSTVTTDASGIATIAHGLLITPRKLTATIRGTTSPLLVTQGVHTGTNLLLKVWTANTGALLGSTSVTIDWQASY